MRWLPAVRLRDVLRVHGGFRGRVGGNVGPGVQVRVADDILLGVGHMNEPDDRRASFGLSPGTNRASARDSR